MDDASTAQADAGAAEVTPKPFIVGIGASAGGLEAIRELVKNLPDEAAASYVVVQHMSPQHKSLLTTLIGRETRLTVSDVEDGVQPQPNAIYVTPPNNDIVMDGDVLRLRPPGESLAEPKPSVDRFFSSIAEHAAERAVGLVLSGTGSDGAYGVQQIRERGGITIAQDDQSAKYDGMPTAAVETGCVDLVMSPIEIGTHLSKILANPRDLDTVRTATTHELPITDLLQILFARTQVDFRDYKPTTVQRRIERRMNALGIDGQQEYTTYCRTNPREVDALFKDLLISVTRFFRDTDEFYALRRHVDRLVTEAGDGPLRVWVAGCATGEEVYSIAILIAEAMGGPEALAKDRLQIFATDIDRDALRVAREGAYSVAAMYDVPSEYVGPYFSTSGDSVRVSSALRDVVLFSKHNVCQDPPFLSVDLICCRNLLIYFGNALQARVLSRFHYAMKPSGVLFLGTAESVTGSDALFRQAEDGSRVFKKRLMARGDRRPPHYALSVDARSFRPDDSAAADQREQVAADRAMFDALARAVGPNAMLVAHDLRILRVYGDLGPYISLTEASRLQLSAAMLRDPLGSEARTLVTLALRNKDRRTGLRHESTDDPGTTIQLEALPVVGAHLEEGLVLLSIRRTKVETQERTVTYASDPEANRQIVALEREIENTREALQQTIEELETSNEELQSLNEELQSTNEELQATNEELETSNEELQSTNEELVTVNEELQINTAELSALNSELSSVLQNIATPVLVVDSALQVSKASLTATRLFNLAAPHERPHLSQAAAPSGFPSLPDMCNEAMRLGREVVDDVLTEDSAYVVRCAPFFDDSGRIRGATIVVAENAAAHELARELQHVIDNAPFFLVHRDAEGRILRLSGASADAFGVDAAAAIGRNYADLADAESAEANLAADRAFLASGKASERSDTWFRPRSGGEKRWIQVERYRFRAPGDQGDSIYVAGVDITDRHAAELEMAELVQLMRMAQEMAELGHWSLDIDSDTVTWSETVFDIHGLPRSADPVPLASALAYYHPEDRAKVSTMVEAARRDGTSAFADLRIQRADDGRVVRVACRARLAPGVDGRPDRLIGVFRALDDQPA